MSWGSSRVLNPLLDVAGLVRRRVEVNLLSESLHAYLYFSVFSDRHQFHLYSGGNASVRKRDANRAEIIKVGAVVNTCNTAYAQNIDRATAANTNNYIGLVSNIHVLNNYVGLAS